MSTINDTTNTTKNTITRGSLIKARMHGGCVADMVVWDVEGETYYLCTNRCYEQLSSGDHSIRPIGYPFDALVLDCGEKNA
ncbi:Uncharacterised protein [Halioglobus japonicus]|nr:Uncharacterised protein [Halioglobus japonicus]